MPNSDIFVNFESMEVQPGVCGRVLAWADMSRLKDINEKVIGSL